MAETNNKDIYQALKQRVLNGKYNIKMRLPTEESLIEEFKVSRYAVRKAIKQLSDEGLVYSVKGKGVVVLEHTPQSQEINLSLKEIDGLQTLNKSQDVHRTTLIADFKQIIVDKKISNQTSFAIGIPVYAIKRVRHINNKNAVLDINYFNAQLVPGITPEIAKQSIYDYIHHELKMKIAVVKRQLRIEHAQQIDYENLNLGINNCVGNMVSFAFNDDGKQFEYTESHFIPDNFIFNQLLKF
ncbi:GntR family transcriptional regulator [Companilactobacillus halodurans]|uniref:UTRA domain-containing protein n=1 Tax=Companilactobacillus halodurans TaxID=2584183 RepID=A0A5P0ZZH8_9LACO|nr:UTRA domain-containing protein [Companilactobacillus halodurans]MQS75360.1 UTRA domain-containing protein [Companilactobacillus halodurans]MQS98420.1 UTRA domain-containing protein [Companilactobacillus halodurans]